MAIVQKTLSITTHQRGTQNITSIIDDLVKNAGIQTGLCHVFIQHTSASLIITENADPTVCSDIETWMQHHILDADPKYRHDYEGDDDMSGHLRTIMTDTSHSIPITNGRLNLGIWQGLFLYEHRTGSFERTLVVTIQGE
ncbi:secondary thiamine-phosphate synthase enzyme YjbQ [Thiosulfativibrio zosterae]|uniref:Secondary thiamine-phosphate synthase enzyme n=1 Tax=Thiosulfativibrio zosterae TaxID=2675053 RepID=A0A6F8PJL6_9GAMM|nr:secondary thiamine-phosphate synthase enzyme YjbQ [Thiosulfativibrio zosterae]BBP42289.1 hypothetical protein THMIRHAT_00350 [Thiosulfativibrio zosterae]